MPVVDFKPKESAEKHSVGQCVCANCKHEWIGSAPLGVTDMECPQCYRRRGGFKYAFGPAEGDESYSCNCGSDDFFIMRRPGQASGAVFCRGCGVEATGWFE